MDTKEVKIWTPEEIRLQEWLATPKKLRQPSTQGALAKELGTAQENLSRWKRQHGFQEAVNALARTYLGDELPAIYDALAREAKKGSKEHIKLALQVTGEYVDKLALTDPTGKYPAPIIYLPAIGSDAPESEQGND